MRESYVLVESDRNDAGTPGRGPLVVSVLPTLFCVCLCETINVYCCCSFKAHE